MKKDNDSLAHTSWNCKYHIVFAPKYWRQYKATIGRIIRELCERKGVNIYETNVCKDRIEVCKVYGVSERKK